MQVSLVQVDLDKNHLGASNRPSLLWCKSLPRHKLLNKLLEAFSSVEFCKTDLEVSAMLDRYKLFRKGTEIETIQLRHNDLVGSGKQGPVRSQRQPCEHARLHG
jgi:hypothetical protein